MNRSDQESSFNQVTKQKLPIFYFSKYFKILIAMLIITIVLVSLGVLLGAKRVQKVAQTNSPQTISLQITSTPEVNSKYQIKLYALADKSIQEILTINGSEFPALDSNKGRVYYITNYENIHEYDMTSKQDLIIYKFKDEKIGIEDLAFLPPNFLYATKTKHSKNFNEYDSIKYIIEINLTQRSSRTIGPVKQRAYTNAVELFNYKGVDYTAAFGGDGCGSYGNIYNSTTQKSLIETGGGCMTSPRYIGSLPDTGSIILSSILPNEKFTTKDGNPFNYKDDLLYAESVLTGEKDPIFDLKTINSSDTVILLEDTKRKIGIIVENELWLIDIESKKLEKKISLPTDHNTSFRSFLTANNLYGWDYEKEQLAAINLNSGNVAYIPFNRPKSNDTIPNPFLEQISFTGRWDNQIFFAVPNF